MSLAPIICLCGCVAGGGSTKVTVSNSSKIENRLEIEYNVNAGRVRDTEKVFLGYCYLNEPVNIWSPKIVAEHKYEVLEAPVKLRDRQHLNSEVDIANGKSRYLLVLTGISASRCELEFSSVRLFQLRAGEYKVKESRALTELDVRVIRSSN